MTAKEAKEITERANNELNEKTKEQYALIIIKIKKAAKKGESSIYEYDNLHISIINYLKYNGYEVETLKDSVKTFYKIKW